MEEECTYEILETLPIFTRCKNPQEQNQHQNTVQFIVLILVLKFSNNCKRQSWQLMKSYTVFFSTVSIMQKTSYVFPTQTDANYQISVLFSVDENISLHLLLRHSNWKITYSFSWSHHFTYFLWEAEKLHYMLMACCIFK